jgi:hypothetical protein
MIVKRLVDRRGFAIQASAAVGGLAAGAVMGRGHAFAEDRDPQEKRLVLLGLNALARAHEMNYFNDGHRGAAMISAYLLCVDNDLAEAATARIVELFDLNWADSKLCQPFPDADPDPEAIEKVGAALVEGGDVLRQVGHNAIFAMHAIKGFRMLPQAATPERVDGVCKLIRSFTPWRDIEPDPEVDPPPFTDQPAASRFILQEANAAIDRFIGFGQGFSGHMLTFGQSLVELAAMGDVELAESCRVAFRKYVTVTRLGPEPGDRRISDHQPSKMRPTDTEYWQQRGDKAVGLGHVFKYPYGYYDLMRRADDAELAKAFDAKAYHIF